jgi:hypothetical protein
MNSNKLSFINSLLTFDEQYFFKLDYENEMRRYNNNPRNKPYFFGYVNPVNIQQTIKARLRQFKESIAKANTDINDNLKLLHDGDLSAVKPLSILQYKFTLYDLNRIRTIMSNRRYIVLVTGEVEVQYLTVNDKSWPKIKDMMMKYMSLQIETVPGSDAIDNLLLAGIKSIEFIQVNRPTNMMKRSVNKSGKFFPYANKSNIDLTRYQIISDKSQTNITNEHCIIYALRLLGEPQDKLNAIITTFEEGAHFAKAGLYQIADILKKNIILTQYQGDNDVVNVKYGTKYEQSLNLALYEGHYFIQEDTLYTEYVIKHYRKFENTPNNYNIFKESVARGAIRNSKAKRIKSLQMINMLMKTDYFKYEDFVSQLDQFVTVKTDKLEVCLDNINNDQELYEYKEKKQYDRVIFYADTETFTEGLHTPLMMSIMEENQTEPYISVTRIKETKNTGSCVYDCLDYAIDHANDREIVIYFHNLKYDYNVIKPYIKVSNDGICEKAGQLYSVTIYHKGVKMVLRDSFKMAGFKLADFQKSFDLDKKLCKKEAIAYGYYTFDNYLQRANVKEYRKFLKSNDKVQFNKELYLNTVSDYDVKTNTFDSLAYYKHYLKYDVLVLCAGMKKMRQALLEITDLDMYDYLTISSISDAYVKKNGAYDGIYGMRYNLRNFCANAVQGGRVHVNDKYKKKIIQELILDYDAVSLYPSAIVRLCIEYGLPIGKARKLETVNYDDIKKLSYAIMKVKITKINKKQQMPMIAHKKIDGTLDYINKVPTDGIITVIDIYTLQDYIKFHNIEYEIIEGVYYNKGFNKKMGSIIRHIFKQRKIYKDAGNESLQLVCKLMLNSIYGKSIMKQSKENIIVICDDKKDEYLFKYFHTIKSLERLNATQWKVYLTSIDKSTNYSHVGCSILSYSKRIMNEVFDIANNNKIPIYYTDTDSIHILASGIKTLETEYEKVYKRVLRGKQLGQFHSDFDIAINKKLDSGIVCDNTIAIKSMFIGKKIYCNILQGYDFVNDKQKMSSHVRIKGVTKAGINDTIDNQYNGQVDKLFEDLCNDKIVKFILNPGENILFEYSSDGVYLKQGDFSRSL